MLGGTPIQQALGKVLALLSNVCILFGKILNLEGVASGLLGVFEAPLEWVVLGDRL